MTARPSEAPNQVLASITGRLSPERAAPPAPPAPTPEPSAPPEPRPMLRRDRELRRQLHAIDQEWRRTNEGPNDWSDLRTRAGWAVTALQVPIDDDEIPRLSEERESRFRRCAEAAGVKCGERRRGRAAHS